ncbi:hypothetical protein CJF30_00003984 [Rutstroemia sp. NJR-2017a BBW]|nr:hypothetical protein CJF30_00003984 [Rutstroemia sp. NJR-2017a BBW]
MTSFVKKTLKKSHSALVERLVVKAQIADARMKRAPSLVRIRVYHIAALNTTALNITALHIADVHTKNIHTTVNITDIHCILSQQRV